MSYDNLSSVSRHIKSNNSGTAKVKIVKNGRDPPLFTGKLINFQNILRNTTQVIVRHRVKILFSVISSPITLERQKWKLSKMKGILLFSPVSWIFTFAVPELLDLIWWKIGLLPYMSYDNLSSVSQNVLKFYQQLTGEKRRIPFIFDNFHFCRSRVIGLVKYCQKWKGSSSLHR
jgi:hypothetical protein